MNKAELIDKIATDMGVTKVQAGQFLQSFQDTVTGELANGGEVAILGFGVFSAKHREAREGRNPQTGESMQLKASRSPAFKAGKGFKDAVAL